MYVSIHVFFYVSIYLCIYLKKAKILASFLHLGPKADFLAIWEDAPTKPPFWTLKNVLF